MFFRFALPAAAGLTLVAVSACGGASAGAGPAATTTRVLNVGSSSFGDMIIDGGGRTVYLFEADSGTQSTCSGECALTWAPVVVSGAPQTVASAMQSLVGTTARSDGSTQATYAGHPLYYYSGDTKAGDTNGEGLNSFGAGWDMLTPAGAKIEKPGS
jgi:predicted lipoprotein with Yx(FWY)xxD motif